jgi:hypothetical protein
MTFNGRDNAGAAYKSLTISKYPERKRCKPNVPTEAAAMAIVINTGTRIIRILDTTNLFFMVMATLRLTFTIQLYHKKTPIS